AVPVGAAIPVQCGGKSALLRTQTKADVFFVPVAAARAAHQCAIPRDQAYVVAAGSHAVRIQRERPAGSVRVEAVVDDGARTIVRVRENDGRRGLLHAADEDRDQNNGDRAEKFVYNAVTALNYCADRSGPTIAD